MSRATFLIDLGDTPEAHDLMQALNQYTKLLGWSRKRVYLMGMAQIIHKNGDNPDLILKIADYLQK